MVDRNRHHRGISRTDEEQLSRLEPRAAVTPDEPSRRARQVPRSQTQPGRAYDTAARAERERAEQVHDADHTNLRERTIESIEETGNVTHRNR